MYISPFLLTGVAPYVLQLVALHRGPHRSSEALVQYTLYIIVDLTYLTMLYISLFPKFQNWCNATCHAQQVALLGEHHQSSEARFNIQHQCYELHLSEDLQHSTFLYVECWISIFSVKHNHRVTV